jgi:hypothetical protein
MARTKAREVRTDVVLPMSSDQACDRLIRLFSMHSGAAPLHLLVGPRRGSDFPAKLVEGTVIGPIRRGSTYVFDLRWEPTGATAGAYPTLEARLGVTSVDATSSLMSLYAEYSPPLGALGATADRALMSRVANATVTAVLHRLAHAITRAPSPDVVGV